MFKNRIKRRLPIITFYNINDVLEEMTEIVFAQKFCELLNCKCLISDDSIDPFTYILITGYSKSKSVEVDPELENFDEYKIISYDD